MGVHARHPTFVFASISIALAGCGRGSFDFPSETRDPDAAPTRDSGGGVLDDVPDASSPGCASTDALCANVCVRTDSDRDHCGGCGIPCTGAAPVCDVGSCRATCTAGRSACQGGCFDLRSDATRCGDCSIACAEGQGCTRGICRCATGQVLCGKRCVDTNADRNNCGTCGRGCPESAVCNAGTCT